MEESRLANFLIDNRPTILDTSLSLDFPQGSHNNIHMYEENAVDQTMHSFHVATNHIFRFGHGMPLPSARLDHHRWLATHQLRQENVVPTLETMTRHTPSIRRPRTSFHRVCTRCGTDTTPMWRRGPEGPQTHCNACGLWYARMSKMGILRRHSD